MTIREAIPEPVFTLAAPAAWDGRAAIEVVPRIANLAAMQAAGAGDVKFAWSAGPFAVTKESVPGKLRLLRAQKSGSLTVTATLENGGRAVTQSVVIAVTEPARDAWVQRTPERDEQPEEGQFYARDDRNEGTLHYRGTLTERAEVVFLKVFADDKPFASETAKPGADLSYTFAVKLKPGLVKYRVEFGTKSGGSSRAAGSGSESGSPGSPRRIGAGSAVSSPPMSSSAPVTSLHCARAAANALSRMGA